MCFDLVGREESVNTLGIIEYFFWVNHPVIEGFKQNGYFSGYVTNVKLKEEKVRERSLKEEQLLQHQLRDLSRKNKWWWLLVLLVGIAGLVKVGLEIWKMF